MECFSFKALNLCSINVRGLRDNTERKTVFLFSRSCNSDIVFFYKKLIQILMMKNSGNHSGAMQCIFLMAQIIELELQYY